MKRIVRLTESDLTRIVRRVVNESNRGLLSEGAGKTAFDLITLGMEGLGTEPEIVDKGVFTIKTKADYDECLRLVQAEDYETIMHYIYSDMEFTPGQYDRSQSAKKADWFGWGKQNDYLFSFESHLKKFNPNEKIWDYED